MRVYVSGPISKGDRAANVRQAIDAGAQLMAAGHAPMVPHLSFLLQLVHPASWETWMRVDLEWVSVSEAVIRLPGESEGADLEVRVAKRRRIPVFDSVDAFLAEYGPESPCQRWAEDT